MKSIGEMLSEMGFNPEAPMDTQKAFFRHLVKEADSKSAERKEKIKTKKTEAPVQMEFDLGDGKKVS